MGIFKRIIGKIDKFLEPSIRTIWDTIADFGVGHTSTYILASPLAERARTVYFVGKVSAVVDPITSGCEVDTGPVGALEFVVLAKASHFVREVSAVVPAVAFQFSGNTSSIRASEVVGSAPAESFV